MAFAKKQRRGNIRKRAADDSEPAQLATQPEESSVVRKQKAAKADNPLAFSTKKPADDKLEPFTFESSRTLQQSTDNRATATLETETAFDRDARCGGISDAGGAYSERYEVSVYNEKNLQKQPVPYSLTLRGACCRALREQVLAQAVADPDAPVTGEYKGMNNYTDYKKVSLVSCVGSRYDVLCR